MGTSSSYGGPGGSGALLPPWAPAVDPPQPATAVTVPPGSPPGAPPSPPQPVPPQTSWSAPKNSLSRYASSGGSGNRTGRAYLKSAVRGFVGAQGGSRRAARAARSGIATVQGLGGFLTAISARGTSAAVREYRLENYLDKSADSLLTAIVDQIAPDGAQLEEAAARAAAVETLSELFVEQGVDGDGLTALEHLTADEIRAVMGRFLCRYIFERLIQTLGKTLENRPAAEVVRLESGVKSYLNATIRLDLSNVDVTTMDWKGPAGRELVTHLYEEAYELMEDV